jgi:hypothetical protein
MLSTGPTWSYAALRSHLTVERLGSYEQAAEGDLERTFRLYEWNMDASAAVMTTTAMVEVIVRNAMDAELRWWAQQRHDRSCWFDVVPLDLMADHRAAVTVTSWVSPDCAAWVAHRSPIPRLEARRPLPSGTGEHRRSDD